MRLLRINSDKDYLLRIRNNDRSVLGELFVKYERMAETFISRQGGRREDAEDALQEAIIILWQKVCGGEFELKSKLGTYLLGIVKNKWRGELRKKKRIEPDVEYDDFESDEIGPLDSYLESEANDLIKDALMKISQQCRELLMMFYFEERSMADIAGILKLSNPSVAKARKYQCKKELQKIMKLHLENEGLSS
jgi:RNA polymerase sigma factor (sigma-70 family)